MRLWNACPIAGIVVALAVALCSETEPSCHEATRGPLAVDLQLAKHEALVGDPIPVHISVSNVSTVDINVPVVMFPGGYWLDFEIIGPAGAMCKQNIMHSYASDIVRRTVLLQPGYSYGARFDLAHLFSMKTPGRYRLTAVYGAPPLERLPRFGPIRTMEKTFTLLERPRKP
jgi:hypothetical protein